MVEIIAALSLGVGAAALGLATYTRIERRRDRKDAQREQERQRKIREVVHLHHRGGDFDSDDETARIEYMVLDAPTGYTRCKRPRDEVTSHPASMTTYLGADGVVHQPTSELEDHPPIKCEECWLPMVGPIAGL